MVQLGMGTPFAQVERPREQRAVPAICKLWSSCSVSVDRPGCAGVFGANGQSSASLLRASNVDACVPQVQLVRIQLRVPEYGWTTQKVFHLLNCLVCSMRGGVFLIRPALDALHPILVKIVLLDLPGKTGMLMPGDGIMRMTCT